MKYVIEYYDVGEGGGLAMFFPEYTRKEIVEVENKESLEQSISIKKDKRGNPFEKKKGHGFGFDYISKAGAIKVKNYK